MLNVQKINDLIKILEQEARVYDDLLKISQNKTSIIIEGKVSELENIVKMEQSLVMQMGRLEMVREGIVDKLSKELEMETEKLTISELLKCLEGEMAIGLKNAQDNMGNVIKELKNTNDLNSKLIRNSLDYIDFSINIIAGADGDGTYVNTGITGEGKKKSFFDVKL